MADILPFKIPKPKDKHKGKTLCKSGFHKWQPVNENPFDTKQGKLISQYRCSRCGVLPGTTLNKAIQYSRLS